jgi:anti-anti-sigma regulatory factor
VRAHGVLTAVPDAAASDHLCWVYEDDAAFDDAVREFLAGGLARGERLLCVGQQVIDRLPDLTPATQDAAALIASGAIETLTLAQAYEAAGPFLPENQLAYYETATQRAMDDGFRGLRVIAEVSELATDAEQRADLVRWEHLADEYSAHGAGFSAMCAYRADLGPDALAVVACVLPLVRSPEEVSSFRLFVDGDRIALAGSVDTYSADRLARVLSSARVHTGGVVLDVASLDFLDVAGCRAIARWAAGLWARSVPLEVIGSSTLLPRIWKVLDLDRLAPVTFSEAYS